MLQRIQTIFFTLALVCIALPLFGSALFTLINDKSEIIVDAFKVTRGPHTQNHFFWIVIVLTVLLLTITLLTYKNRKLQMKLGWTSFLLLFVLSSWIAVTIFFNPDFAKTEKSLGFGFIALIVALPLIYFGLRGVKKDQALIDSLNRLR